jgi:hypothetical protein
MLAISDNGRFYFIFYGGFMISTFRTALAILCLLMVSSSYLWGQSSVHSSGSDATGTGGTASFSVGQVVYTTQSSSSGTSHQGVQQPYEFYTVTSVEEGEGIMLSSKIFPNPAQTAVTLSVGDIEDGTLHYELYDLMGKQIHTDRIVNKITNIPLHECANGTYMLKIRKSDTIVKTFTIVKHL